MPDNRAARPRGTSVLLATAATVLLVASACSDPTSIERFPVPPDQEFPANATYRFVARDSLGQLRTLVAEARRIGEGTRQVAISIDGRHVLTLNERWELRGQSWLRVARSAGPARFEGRSLLWDGTKRGDDAPMTPGVTLVSADSPCDDAGVARAEGAEGACWSQALKFVSAGLLADASIALAISNPLLAPAAIAAIANVAVAYDEYITCLRNEARME